MKHLLSLSCLQHFSLLKYIYNVTQCLLMLARSKSMIWINENVLGAHGNNFAQHFFHLKETEGE